MSPRNGRPDRAGRLQRVITKFTEQKISMLHVFSPVAKRARAAITETNSGRAGVSAFRASTFLRLKNTRLPQLLFP
jgi:hypothetical protein